MRNARYVLVPLLFAVGCSANSLPAGNDTPANSPQLLATVSFDLYHNRVYLPVEVNRRLTIPMILDTGAAISGLSSATAQALQLKTSGEAQLAGNGESNQKITFARNVEFHVGEANLAEKTVAVIPFDDLEAREGRLIAGVLGVDLFRKYVVEIDYQNKSLSLFDPEGFVYRGAGVVVPLTFSQGAALFRAEILLPSVPSIQAQLAIDSGTYSALRLYRGFLQKHSSLENSKAPSVVWFGFGIGGEFPERPTRVGGLQISSLRLHAPLTRLSEANAGATESSSYDGTIGGAILRRFRVILDYSRAEMILEPNAEFAKPFPADTSGIILAGSADFKSISIRHVIPDTPAAAAGIKEGDTLLSVNGSAAATLGLERIRLLFLKSGVYHLQLQRGSKKIPIDLATHELVP